jgi:hypothetical protein
MWLPATTDAVWLQALLLKEFPKLKELGWWMSRHRPHAEEKVSFHDPWAG